MNNNFVQFNHLNIKTSKNNLQKQKGKKLSAFILRNVAKIIEYAK